MTDQIPLEPDYKLEEVASTLRISSRWIRDRIRAGNEGRGPFVEHVKRGHKIFFTSSQVEKLRSLGTVAPEIGETVTTGHKKKAS